MSALIFLGILVAFVVVAFVVSRITGARNHYLENWKPDEGEQVLFDDRQADTYLVPKVSRSNYNYFSRPRRGFVLVTDRRLLAGTKPLFSKRQMIQYVMYVGSAPDPAADSFGGGLLTRGYQTLVLDPEAFQRVMQDGKPYIVATPSPEAASSFNLKAIRIYTDHAAGMPLPEGCVATVPQTERPT